MAEDLRLRVILNLADKALGPIKRIAAGSKGLADKLREAQTELSKLEKNQKNITAFRRAQVAVRQQSRGLGDYRDKLEKANDLLSAQRERHVGIKASLRVARAEYDKLASAYMHGGAASQDSSRKLELSRIELLSQTQAYEQSLSTLNKYKAQTKNAERSVSQLQDKLGKSSERLERYKGYLQEAGISGKFLAANARDGASAIDRQRQALDRLIQKEEALDKLRQRHAQSMRHVGMATGAGLALQAAGRRGLQASLGPVRAFIEHEDAMLGIARQVPGARDEMGRLTAVYRQAEQDVRALSAEIPLSTVAITDMMTAAARMEVPAEHLREQVKLAAEMAIAFDAVPDEIAESMGKVAKNYKIPITGIRALADSINYLDDNAISKGADIIDYLNRTAGIVSVARMTAAQNAALGSTLLTAGAGSESAATAVNALLQRLAAGERATAKVKKALRDLSLSPAALQKALTTDAMGALEKVLDRLATIPEAQRVGVMTYLSGVEHTKTLAQLVAQRGELTRQLQLAQGPEATGSMAREAAARYATLSAQWQKTKNSAFNLAAVLGESLKPALLEAMAALMPIVERVRAWVQANPAIASGLLKAALAITALTLAAGLVLVPLALIAGKLLLVRFVLAQMVVAGTGLMRLAPIIRALLVPLLGLNPVAWAVAAAFGLLLLFWRPIAAFIGGVFIGALDAVKPALKAVGDAFAPVISVVAQAGRWFISLLPGLQFSAEGLEGFSSAGRLVGQVFGNLLVALASLPVQFYQLGVNVVTGFIDGFVSMVGLLGSKVAEIAGNVGRFFAKPLGIRSPSRVFMALGQHIPEGAALGIQRGTPALRAAALAMAALPALAPMPAMASAHGAPGPAGGATTISITVNAAPGQDPQAIARAVAAELDRRQRAQRTRVLSQLSDIE